MRTRFSNVLAAGFLLAFAFAAFGQTARTDVIWARRVVEGSITLDGKLDEPAWNNAESVLIKYGQNAGDPGSGWRNEGGAVPTDPLDATLKFLVVGNQLYLGLAVKDSSVGGGLFNRFDGVLMNLRRKESPDRPAPPFEYFYGWVTEPWADPATGNIGALPSFFGAAGGPRTPENLEIWDAVTTVQGISNSDTLPDVGYTMEFRLNLTPRGYDVTRPQGDIVSFNISIYDTDWQWPVIPGKLSGNRTWFQGPFSAPLSNTVRIHARPDVTVSSGEVPEVEPELIVPNAEHYNAPEIDGILDEAVWAKAPSFDVRFGDTALRETYPSIGPLASGQFQPEVGGGRAAVLDPGDATFKYFFKGDWLYVGVDVRDGAVIAVDTDAQWDGIRFMINDRVARHPEDHYLLGREFIVRFDATGQPVTGGDLTDLIAAGGAAAGVTIKPNTTINNPADVDEGFFIELAIDLTKLGYPGGRGDGVAWLGALLFDGDTRPNPTDDYGNWTWWFKERGNNASPVWAYMDPNTFVPGGEPGARERADAVWARTVVDGTITLDGKLDEPAWSKAEPVRLQYGKDAGIPGSGWRNEGGAVPTDPLDATLKFLVVGNQLYLGVAVKDSSVGGGLFNRFDGVLMNLRRKESPDRPAPPFEYFYGWVTEPWADPATGNIGALPSFFGAAGGPRTPENLEIWDAVTSVAGITNSDTVPDAGYTMEFRLNLTPRGYDVTRPEGDIVSFNISIYDTDWQWPVIPGKLSGNRTWFQGPFSAPLSNTVRIHARPDVTVNTQTLPELGPELIIPNAVNYATPTIDGQLNEAVWAKAPSFDVRFGDTALRATYPSIGPLASGQFQPEVGGGRAAVLDPGDATFKYFFKDDMLYLGVDARDGAVIAVDTDAQWDGIRFMINDRVVREPDNHDLLGREVIVRFDPAGQTVLGGSLVTEVADAVTAAVTMKPNTTINNPADVDEGFFIELAIDLTKVGYPAGRGDGVIFLGALLFDGDTRPNPTDDYGNWTWWFKERGNNASPVWAYMDPNTIVTGVQDRAGAEGLPQVFTLYGNYPNPFNPATTISFGMPEAGLVTLKVYDILGRSVLVKELGMKAAGRHEAVFEAKDFTSGAYFYRLQMTAPSGKKQSTLYGRMMVIK
ncbi:MAG: hypothetical protein DKINENOH_01145 [bacterium]|nr:hypothetical protein [bacterium]